MQKSPPPPPPKHMPMEWWMNFFIPVADGNKEAFYILPWLGVGSYRQALRRIYLC